MHFERSIMFFLHLSGKSDLTRDPSINARGRDLTLQLYSWWCGRRLTLTMVTLARLIGPV